MREFECKSEKGQTSIGRKQNNCNATISLVVSKRQKKTEQYTNERTKNAGIQMTLYVQWADNQPLPRRILNASHSIFTRSQTVLSECLYLNQLVFLDSSKCFVFISSWYFFYDFVALQTQQLKLWLDLVQCEGVSRSISNVQFTIYIGFDWKSIFDSTRFPRSI